ncbi:DUF1499 domain-containing protein [Henriciella mobilis]|uniref:DUF1499 domain-containing protein n=1 Tax=Henriciella mobilis TaxID=2305467 RepID=UPI000E664E2B|nr:DUF1499 domain-containing protein [Henriciella mobilis]RIJ15058.1 DUF1499 domain-containing protein [Henriciella mobilis]RIJ20228.1 DUF1499 domain-containing protein [Henriciella mobilis]
MSARVDFEKIERPGSPNTYLVAPEGLCANATPDADAPSFDLSPEALFAKVESALSDKSNWSVTHRDPATRQIDLVARTPVLKFKDDVAIRVLPDGANHGKSRLAVYSRSRVGYHDLGANRKRVDSLIAELK